MAFRMQASVPELVDFSKETKETLDMYGKDAGNVAYANHCLMARRLLAKCSPNYHSGHMAISIAICSRNSNCNAKTPINLRLHL